MRELDLLSRIYDSAVGLPDRVDIPPGDDMGAVRIGDSRVLVSVDQLADTVHVDLDATSIEKVGRKAITRSLSDVAAMGSLPCGAVVAACLPRDFGEERANSLFDAIRCTAEAYNCPVFGGDIAMWDHPMLLTVTVLAGGDGIAPLLRCGARVGDAVCVTGRLGGSQVPVDGYTHHLDFEPRLATGRALAAGKPVRPNCMIDLSDGLAQDLAHLCRASVVAAIVDADDLPVSRGAHALAADDPTKLWQHAMGDGEDYELCFTVTADKAAHIVGREVQGAVVSRVGTIIENDGGPPVRLRLPDGTIQPIDRLGWEHRGK